MAGQEEPAGSRLSKIVDAAYRCLARDGYQNVSIKDIAKEAGVAPGLLHYYFKGKEELLVAVVRQALKRHREEFFVQYRQFADPMEGLAASLRWIEQKWWQDRASFMLISEMYTLALRDEQVRLEMRKTLQEEHARLAEVVSTILGARPEKTGLSREALAALALAVFDGLTLHAMIDPAIDPFEDIMVLGRAMIAWLAT